MEATEPVPGVAIAKQELDEAVRLGLPQATIAARRERHEHLTRAREQFLAKAKGELKACEGELARRRKAATEAREKVAAETDEARRREMREAWRAQGGSDKDFDAAYPELCKLQTLQQMSRLMEERRRKAWQPGL